MKIRIVTALSPGIRYFLLFGIAIMLSCNNTTTPDVRDRNNELDGDDTKQPVQNQDSVNRILNEEDGGATDTLPNGLRE